MGVKLRTYADAAQASWAEFLEPLGLSLAPRFDPQRVLVLRPGRRAGHGRRVVRRQGTRDHHAARLRPTESGEEGDGRQRVEVLLSAVVSGCGAERRSEREEAETPSRKRRRYLQPRRRNYSRRDVRHVFLFPWTR
jgi:hypothetical protein